MKTRIYKVEVASEDGKPQEILVKAPTQAQAKRYIVDALIRSVRLASQDDIVSMMTAGAKVKEAK